MTLRLSGLGPYRIERSEDYDADPDRSWGEIIRVRGSKPKPPYFPSPSHVYKYSESELALYLKERKNLWRKLGKLLGERIEISDPEIVLIFPVTMFGEVATIVPFVRKALRKKPLSEEERRRMAVNLQKGRERTHHETPEAGREIKQNGSNSNETVLKGNSNPHHSLFRENNRYFSFRFMSLLHQGSGPLT